MVDLVDEDGTGELGFREPINPNPNRNPNPNPNLNPRLP